MKKYVFSMVGVGLLLGWLYLSGVCRPGDAASEKQLLIKEWNRVTWTSNPLLPDERAYKPEVLGKLLTLDREEIKFWQDKFFTISFWISATMLAIVSFVIERESSSKKGPPFGGTVDRTNGPLRGVAALTCVCLGGFYLFFAREAENAMVTNDYDIRGFQGALGLRQPGTYLVGQAIYGNKDVLKFTTNDIKGLPAFIYRLKQHSDEVSAFLWTNGFSARENALTNVSATNESLQQATRIVVQVLNSNLQGGNIYEGKRFTNVVLRPETRILLELNPTGVDIPRLNRLLIEDSYPQELASQSTDDLFGIIGHPFISKFVWFNIILASLSLVVLLVPLLGRGELFALKAPAAKKVELAGDFTDWKPQRMKKDRKGLWRIRVVLEAGTYRYRFIVDDEWRDGSERDRREPNGKGGDNTIREVA